MNTTANYNTNETLHGGHARGLICWRSIFTGILVSLLSYYILSALGAGIGGFRIAHIIENNENGSGLLTGAGVWLGISAVVSLFLGSYFATRLSTTLNRKIGGAQGVVIAAIFFLFLMHGASNTMGSLSVMNGDAVFISQTDAEKAARTFADIGWVLFATFILGTGAAILGGYEGTGANGKKPMLGVSSK